MSAVIAEGPAEGQRGGLAQDDVDTPDPLKRCLDGQQDLARELHALLVLLDQTSEEDEGVISIAARLAGELQRALDGAAICQALAVPRRCAECAGTGFDEDARCEHCDGTGRERGSRD